MRFFFCKLLELTLSTFLFDLFEKIGNSKQLSSSLILYTSKVALKHQRSLGAFGYESSFSAHELDAL